MFKIGIYVCIAKKKKNQWHILRHGKGDFIQGGEAIKISIGTAAMEFCSGVERLGSTLNTA